MPFWLIQAYCIIDTGDMGMMILGDHMLGARYLAFIIPGPQAHWAKLAFEKYFLYTRTHGHVEAPRAMITSPAVLRRP
jgi:sulfide:quinone oxidoreductase